MNYTASHGKCEIEGEFENLYLHFEHKDGPYLFEFRNLETLLFHPRIGLLPKGTDLNDPLFNVPDLLKQWHAAGLQGPIYEIFTPGPDQSEYFQGVPSDDVWLTVLTRRIQNFEGKNVDVTVEELES